MVDTFAFVDSYAEAGQLYCGGSNGGGTAELRVAAGELSCVRHKLADLLASGRLSNNTVHNNLYRTVPESCAGGSDREACAHPEDIWHYFVFLLAWDAATAVAAIAAVA